MCEEPRKAEDDLVEDDLVEEAAMHLADRKYPEGCSANRKMKIRIRAEKFVLQDGKLYYWTKLITQLHECDDSSSKTSSKSIIDDEKFYYQLLFTIVLLDYDPYDSNTPLPP
uniref:Uncharacterized protein n=1 Tax=Amphimedon queenslandica TaxID=400682 RepID=A0A1X7V963_AMPQE